MPSYLHIWDFCRWHVISAFFVKSGKRTNDVDVDLYMGGIMYNLHYFYFRKIHMCIINQVSSKEAAGVY